MLVLATFPWSCNLLNITTSDLNFFIVKIIFILFSTWQLRVLSVRFALYVFDVYIDVFNGRYDCQGNMRDRGKKMSQIYRGELHVENIFAFFVLMNFQLSAKHFSVLRCYFMKREVEF